MEPRDLSFKILRGKRTGKFLRIFPVGSIDENWKKKTRRNLKKLPYSGLLKVRHKIEIYFLKLII